MAVDKTPMAVGWRIYGVGVMALDMVCVAEGRTSQSCPPTAMRPGLSAPSRERGHRQQEESGASSPELD